MTQEATVTARAKWTVEQAEAALDATLRSYRDAGRMAIRAEAGTVGFAFALSTALGSIGKAVEDLTFAWYREHGAAAERARTKEADGTADRR